MTDEAIYKDPAADGDLGATLKAIFTKQMQAVDGSLPAVVVSYDRTTNRATVRPLIAVLATSGATTKRAQVASVPVLALGGGGFVISFPIKAGDTGWIKANDRDISLYLQSSRDAQPNTHRVHSFADGHFIPDVMAKHVIAGEDANAVVIQSYDGSTKITLDNGKVKIKAAIVTIEGVINHTGVLNNTGGVVIDGLAFGSHKHGNVTHGTDTSGGPTA